ncbi:MAG TPA: lamin tail domain-containing protein [Bacteroidales bacterium]|nr:lamin tail domain-containing protein [Bacteroidales bacterium]
MKTIKFLLILVVAFIFMGNVNAQTNLAAWHFDVLAVAPNTPKIIQADYGLQSNSATIYLDGTHGASDFNCVATNPELTAFSGNTLNDQRPTTLAGQALAIANNSANGKGFVFVFSTTGYENIKISYAYRATSTGFNKNTISYSTDGINFIKLDSAIITNNTLWFSQSFDFSNLTNLDNQNEIYLKLTVNGATAAAGNMRIDNIYIKGDTIISVSDTIPPTLISAEAISDTQAKIAFSEPVDATAENINNYSITLGVSSAVRLTGLDSVLLTFTQPLVPNTEYQLCASGIQDLAGNAMTSSQCDNIEWITTQPQDTIPPQPLNAWLENLSEVKVSFNEPVDASAENIANYTGINVATATRNTTLDTVTLTLSTPIPNATPTTMYVSNISDTAGNVNTNVYEFTLFMDTVVHTPNWVITEIMYNPPESGTDSLEFIEIMNNTAFMMNFKNYTLKYGTTSFTFSEDINVNPYGYVLVSPIANKASAFYGKTFIQGSTIGISNSGTSIVIKDPNGITVDTVRYYTTAPWPTDANANGYSLSLCDPSLDNNDGANWSLGTRPFSIVNGKMVYADPGEGCYVAPDTIPPTLISAEAISDTQAKIAFSEPVDATAENINNYSITLGVSSAVRLTGLDSVLLTFTQPLVPNTEYQLCASGIQDLAGNAMTSSQCDNIEWITTQPQDTIPPQPLNAWLENLSEVKVSFNEPVDASAENIANYTGINVATATRNTTLDTVTLTLSTPIPNATPTTMYVSNISDTAGNVNTNVYEFTLFMDTVVHTPNWVITEIMYNPPESGTDSLEFIEIMNNTAFMMNFKNYTLKYGTTSFTFSEDINVNPYGYVLVSPIANKASAFYGKTFIQGSTIGISNSGTSIVIKDPNGITVDTVRYYTTAPWPTDANANGYSLSLCDPSLDNNDGANWSLGTRPFSIVNGKMVYADPGEGCYVAPDTIPPTPLNAWATSYTTVKISFDEPVNNSAENINNYSGIDISTATRNTTHDTVTLTLATPLQNAVHYTLYITNIADETGNINSNTYDFDIFLDLSAPSIVITEIMYNPPESGTDSLEFIELYNNDTYTIDMKEYTLTYGANTFTFPDGITIAPNAFLIIAPNSTAVNNFYGVNAIQGSTAGIPNTGTAIVLKTPYGVVVDTLTFGSGTPWPTDANGQGPSLTLCDPNSDNTDPTNWSLSDHEYNIINGYMVKADPNSLCIIDNVANFNKEIINIYPNPASDKVFINTNKTINSIVIYDILGNQVAHYEQVNNNQYTLDVNDLLAQIYIVKIVFVDNSIVNKKLIIE